MLHNVAVHFMIEEYDFANAVRRECWMQLDLIPLHNTGHLHETKHNTDNIFQYRINYLFQKCLLFHGEPATSAAMSVTMLRSANLPSAFAITVSSPLAIWSKKYLTNSYSRQTTRYAAFKPFPTIDSNSYKFTGHESNGCPLPRTTEAKQCYHCQGLGHVQADCPTLRISGAGTSGRCYNCGQPGHLAVR